MRCKVRCLRRQGKRIDWTLIDIIAPLSGDGLRHSAVWYLPGEYHEMVDAIAVEVVEVVESDVKPFPWENIESLQNKKKIYHELLPEIEKVVSSKFSNPKFQLSLHQ